MGRLTWDMGETCDDSWHGFDHNLLHSVESTVIDLERMQYPMVDQEPTLTSKVLIVSKQPRLRDSGHPRKEGSPMPRR